MFCSITKLWTNQQNGFIIYYISSNVTALKEMTKDIISLMSQCATPIDNFCENFIVAKVTARWDFSCIMNKSTRHAIVLVWKCISVTWGEWIHPTTSSNWPISQIPQCIRQISHNATFCNRNVHTCAHFCYKMLHCGMWHRCILGFVRWVYCACSQNT